MAPFDAYLPSLTGPAYHGDTLDELYDGGTPLAVPQPGSSLYSAVLAARDGAIADEATPAHSIFKTHPASLLVHLASQLGLPADVDRLREGLERLSHQPKARQGQSIDRLLEMRRQAVAAVWQMRVRRMIDADAADRVLVLDYRTRGIGSARRAADADVQATMTRVARRLQGCLYWLRDNPDAASRVAVDCLSRLGETHDFSQRPHLYPAVIVQAGRDLLSLHRRSSVVRRHASDECGCVALAHENGGAVDSIDDETREHGLAAKLQDPALPSAARERQEAFKELLSRIVRSDLEGGVDERCKARRALKDCVEDLRAGGYLTPRLEELAKEADAKLQKKLRATQPTALRPSATMSPAWREAVLPPDAGFMGWIQSYRVPTQAELPL